MWLLTSTRKAVPSALRRRAILCAILGLAACGSAERPAPVAQGDGRTYVYRCPDDFRFSVRFQGDTAVVTLPDRELRLPRVVAASGARYAAGDVVYWDKGAEALLEISELQRTGCRGQPAGSPWEVARLLGLDFRGVGQEPGWIVEIDAGRMIRLLLDYGERRVQLPAPEPIRQPDGGLVYEIRAPEHSVRVVIEDRACQDVMSGEEFSQTVVVTIDGHEYRGCGRFLSASPLLGTLWRLHEVGDEPARAGEDAGIAYIRLRSDEKLVEGNTGCNSLSGAYLVEGERLEFGELVTTLRACTDPAVARQEQSFTAALNATDRFAIRADTLILYSGTDPLARLVATDQR